MYNNVRQKILPYDKIFVAPKSFTCKTFFWIRSIAYENLRLTANNRDKSWQHTKNYDFLIRTLSHLKIRMWETTFTGINQYRYSNIAYLLTYLHAFKFGYNDRQHIFSLFLYYSCQNNKGVAHGTHTHKHINTYINVCTLHAFIYL